MSAVDLVSDLSLEERSTVRVFQDSTPSVVNITNVAAVRGRYSLDVRKIPLGSGSGFIWDDKGHIVTNFHVIKVSRLKGMFSGLVRFFLFLNLSE